MGFLEQSTDDQAKQIYAGFGATEETVKRDIQTLIEWLEKQPYLPNVKDEALLRMFFLRSGGSLEKSKSMIEMYYIFKAQFIDTLTRIDPTSETFKKYYRTFSRFPLPKLLPDLSRVFLVYSAPPKENDEPIYDSEEFFSYLVTHSMISCFMCGVHKHFVVIIDCKYTTAARVQLTLSVAQRIVKLSNTIARTRKIYMVNSSKIMEPIFQLGRFISKKIFEERMIFWNKSEKDLPEIIPKECLPYEYGGTLGSRDELRDSYLKEMESYKDWLTEESKIYADLSKVPESRKMNTDMGQFGVEGSFRKINLD